MEVVIAIKKNNYPGFAEDVFLYFSNGKSTTLGLVHFFLMEGGP